MHFSYLLSLSLLPGLGLAKPTMPMVHLGARRSAGDAAHSLPHRDTATTNSTAVPVDTNTLATVNYFPDPVVHCSGRSLTDSGDTNPSGSLSTAVTTASNDGLYGACNVNGKTVDGGDGSLAWKSGKVQVYYCNHGFAATDCDVNEYWRADALIADKCGAQGGGWVSISDWSLTIGRDPTNSGGSFRSECGSSLHGVNANFVVTNLTTSS